MANMHASQTKSALRTLLRQRRESLSKASRIAFSQAVNERLIAAIDWSHIRRVNCYIPIESLHEVSTWPLLHYLWHHWPNIETAVPGPLKSGESTAVAIDVETKWCTTGVLSYPLTERLVSIESFDLIIVPMLGFDRNLSRLGYGTGYYDRFLSGQRHTQVVGLSFSCCLVAKGLPHEKHDVPLQMIVTENRLYK
jgi:5-formyltetrahydrofolate cyclo-ligase